MKRIIQIVICFVILVSSAGFADGKSALKELWFANYNTDLDFSSVHYTTNVVVVVYENKYDKSLAIGKFSYCSGEKLNNSLMPMCTGVLPMTIQVYENRLFFVSSDKESEYELTCTDLNLNSIWSYKFTDQIAKTSIWIEIKDDFLWINVDKGVMVFEYKTGKTLSVLESKYIYDRIYAGHILVKTNTLKLIDPYTGKAFWDYEIPDSGIWCFGIKKGIVMLSRRPSKNDHSTKLICLDANNGKELFSLDYNTEIVGMGISRNLLCVLTKGNENSYTIDAFNIENWIYQWTLKKQSERPLITENSIFSIYSPCCGTQLLTKIDPVTGKEDNTFEIFFHDFNPVRFFRKIKFQANRIIVAFRGITCYIDESF